MTKKYFLTLFLLPSLSFAGDFYEMGNPGYAVKCPKENVRALDIYETVNRYGLTLDTQFSGVVEKRVSYLISKLDKHNPQRAELYRGWFKTFFDEAEFKADYQITPLTDHGLIPLKKGCSLKQVVFQRSPEFLNDHRYIIDLDLWKQLSTLDQAALIMHELIFRELAAAPNYQTTSESTRSLNAWLQSMEFEKATLVQYLEKLQALNIAQAEFNGTAILLAAKDTLTNTWSKLLPLWSQETVSPSMLTLDASRPFQIGSLKLDSECFANDKLLTMGILTVSEDEGDTTISPIQDTLNIVSCRSLYASDDKTFSVAANVWKIRHKDKLQMIQGQYGRANESIAFARYGKFTFISVVNFPVTVVFNMNGQQTPENISFVGKACYGPEGDFINVWTESPLDPLVTWKTSKLSKFVTALPTCH